MTSTASGSVLVEGTVKIDFTLTAESTLAPEGAAVATAPPAGAPVVDLFELLLGGMIEEMEDMEMPFAA